MSSIAQPPAQITTWRDLARWFGDIVFPAQCINCDAFTDTPPYRYICETCIARLEPRDGSECIGCKKTSTDGTTCLLCRFHWQLDQLFVAGSYDEPLIKSAIHLLKYRFVAEIAQPLAQFVANYTTTSSGWLEFLDRTPLVIPVPLHTHRQRWRGFNQAVELARHIAPHHNLTLAPHLLVRRRYLAPQAQTHSKTERLTRLENSFFCPDTTAIADRAVLLVDDVCTSGATLDACARTLKSAGARHVAALVVARGS